MNSADKETKAYTVTWGDTYSHRAMLKKHGRWEATNRVWIITNPSLDLRELRKLKLTVRPIREPLPVDYVQSVLGVNPIASGALDLLTPAAMAEHEARVRRDEARVQQLMQRLEALERAGRLDWEGQQQLQAMRALRTRGRNEERTTKNEQRRTNNGQ